LRFSAPVEVLRGSAAAAMLLLFATAPVSAALTPPQRTVLKAYLDALSHGRYAAAYALLSADERRYYGSVDHFTSVYTADRFMIRSYTILGSESVRAGTVAVVSERVGFVDHAHERAASVIAKVPYALVSGPGGTPVIRDPGHPWRAYAPAGFAGESGGGLHATVRKISFFTGRVELIVNFQNYSGSAVTLLPYGRSVLRDASGHVYHPIATRLSALTDKTLYIGLRLPSSGQYTGFLTFATPDRFTPLHLRLTIAPALADGADAPFALELGPYSPPP
jgi:hypothetical protein